MKNIFTLCLLLIIQLSALESKDFWEKLNNPYPGTYFEGIWFDQVILYNDEFYISSGQYLYISLDTTKSWKRTNIFEYNYSIHSFNIAPNGDIYAGLGGYGLWKSTDKGNNWTRMAEHLVNDCVQSVLIKGNGDIYAFSWNQIIKSTDNGISWDSTRISFPLSCAYWNSFISTTNNKFFLIYDCEYLIKSTDDCKSWEKVSIPCDTSEYDVKQITTDNKNNLFIVVTHKDILYNKILKSTDYGLTWIEISQELEKRNFGYIFACPNGDLIACTYYYDQDSTLIKRIMIYKNDNNWYEINYNLPVDKFTVDFAIDSKERLIVAQNEGFLFRSTETYDNFVDVSDDVINSSDIHIFPNPTAGIIKLRYRIETHGNVSIFLTDALGSKRVLMAGEYKFPGDYIEDFDLSALPQGVYHIVMQANGNVYSEKVVVIR